MPVVIVPPKENNNMLPASGMGLVSGLGTTIATVYGRREERQRIEKQNAIYTEAASRMAARGRADMMRQNQGASGQLAYMQYRSKNNPQVLEALRSMYASRVQAGAQMNSQSLAAANEMLGRRQAKPTNGKYDAWAGIGAGLAQAGQTFGSIYKPGG
jgi:hypothetical protein